MRRVCLTVIATTSLVGCLGGGSAQPRTYYVLQDRAPAEVASPGAPGRQSLVVAGTAVDAFYDADSLVFSPEPGQRAYYQFASWTDRPANLVVQLAERRLEAHGRFASVANLTTGVRADLLLNLGVREFYHDVAVKPSVVRVEITGELIDWRSRSLLARRTFAVSAPVRTDDAKGAADAFDHAITEAIDALVPWVETQAASAAPGSG